MAATAFDAVAASLDYPMFVVTAAAGDERSGCLVGFTTQVSISPARFLACLSDKNHTYPVARHAGRLAVHLLPPDRSDLAHLFGEETGDDVDKFASCRWHAGPHGEPLLDDALTWFSGPIVERARFGDHVGFVIEPDAGEAAEVRGYISFAGVKDLDAGHDA